MNVSEIECLLDKTPDNLPCPYRLESGAGRIDVKQHERGTVGEVKSQASSYPDKDAMVFLNNKPLANILFEDDKIEFRS